MSQIPKLLEIPELHAAYRAGLTPELLARALLARIDDYPDPAVFITRLDEAALGDAAALDPADIDRLPLFGVPYVVKDNIDVAGVPTTAGCPEFAYLPERDAVCVARLRAAGAILLGKVNLDQFATGLNGTRSPYGAPRCVFDAAYISGGSSSGSAVAVGAGLAAFSLGTDTAGSGRVPAAFNNIVGLKPAIGRIPATGVVPACKTLDCVSIFANSSADAMAVLRVAEGSDAGDAYSRVLAESALPAMPRVGVLASEDRDFGGDGAAAMLYEAALGHAAALGWTLTPFDYAPFRGIAAALYGGASVAERLAAIRPFFEASPDAIHPVVRSILEDAANYSAADAFAEIYRIQALRRLAQAEFAAVDLLLLPTAPTIFSVDAMLAAPVAANARLGIYTNFVNFLDLSAIAIPGGFGAGGLPFGVTLIGTAFAEAALAAEAERLHLAIGAGSGLNRIAPAHRMAPGAVPGETTLVVAGAHLSGMVLNHQLLELGGRLLEATTTALDYKLFSLATTPPKPGLARAPGFEGQGIAVEVWSLGAAAFGRFVASLPAPMGIGKVTLADGTTHPGFLCESYAMAGAEDITAYGGWRAYRAASERVPAARI